SDGTSSSLLEAMACGAFPVVTRIRGNEPWIVPGETGLMFDPADAVSLADSLARAITDESLRRRAAPLNRALVEREGNQRMNIDRILDMLRRAAGMSD